MGLSAVVFKSADRLKNEYSREFEVVGVETGEASAMDSRQPLSLPELLAGEARLGNAAEVGFLSDAVASALGTHSFIEQNVLYSASHAGDSIALDRFHLLRDELNRLKKGADSNLARFIGAMDALMDVAQKENNPIVFV